MGNGGRKVDLRGTWGLETLRKKRQIREWACGTDPVTRGGILQGASSGAGHTSLGSGFSFLSSNPASTSVQPFDLGQVT